jgi:hypothetical protein
MSWKTLGQRWILLWQRWLAFFSWADLSGPSFSVEPPTPAPAVSASLNRVALVVDTPVCEVCGKESTGLKTHDGHWRCAEHKNVACEKCGHAISVPPPLKEHINWVCAAHG